VPSFDSASWQLSSTSSIPVAHHPEPSGEPHQLEWVGPMKNRPVTRSARANVLRRSPRLSPRGLAPAHAPNDVRPGVSGVGRRCASLSRDFDYRSLQHDSDTRARLRAVDPLPCEAVAPVHVCSARHSTCVAQRRAEEPCRLPFFSAPSLAGDVPYLSVPGARPMVWLAGKRGELAALRRRAAWAGNPRAKDPRSASVLR